jgi:hypothetical protein
MMQRDGARASGRQQRVGLSAVQISAGGRVFRRWLPGALISLFLPALAGAWTPPVGIPTPPFPADLDVARPSLPSPWTADQAGWYFVASSGCSDSRTYGNPSASRCSLPASPAAGSVIVINGTISGDVTVSFNGTSGSPIWVMGYNPASRPVFSGPWGVNGSYLIFDNLSWNATNLSEINLTVEGNHLMVRDCSMRNTYDGGYGAGIGSGGTNLVYYRITVYDQGSWSGATDVDRHGVKVYAGSDQWFVDSTFYHNQGDGIQVGDWNNTASAINRIYIGRNQGYENMQTCFWTKNATDVIFSSNNCYGITYSNGNIGPGLGGQYDPKYIWYLNNRIYNTKSGIMIAGTGNGGGGPWYVIGNLLYSIESPSQGCNNYNMGGISYRNDGGLNVLFNTFHDIDLFVAIPNGSGIVVRDNIFSSKRGASCSAFDVGPTFTHDYNLFSSSSYDPGSESHRVVGDPKFVAAGSEFSLQSTSPAIDAGSPTEEAVFATFKSRYGIDIRKDFSLKARPQGTRWDIGAFELQSSGMTAPSNLRFIP